MRYGLFAAWVGHALVAPLSVANAQEAGADCATSPAAVPPELAGWSARQPIVAAGDASSLPAATLKIGSAADAGLKPRANIHYVATPQKPGDPASHGGLFAFTVEQAGSYRVALGAAAWVDVVKGTAALSSSAHGHGPACSGVRKMVDFALTPGSYILQIAGSSGSTLPIMIVRVNAQK